MSIFNNVTAFDQYTYQELIFTHTAALHASGDVVADIQVVAAAVGGNDQIGQLVGFAMIDRANNTAADMEIIVSRENSSIGTEGSAFSANDDVVRQFMGIIKIAAGDWVATTVNKIATFYEGNQLPIAIEPKAGTDDIYMAVVTRGTPTYGTTVDLRAQLIFRNGKTG